MATPEPTCIVPVLYGQVADLQGTLSAGKQLTLNTVEEQRVRQCLIRPSLRSWTLDTEGRVPSTVTAVGGSSVYVSVERSNTQHIAIEDEAPSSLAEAIGDAQPIPPQDIILGISVADTGDFGLTASVNSAKIATLQPGTVRHFSLETSPTVNGNRIKNVGVPVEATDMATYDTPIGGDFTGTLGSPLLKWRGLAGTVTFPEQPLEVNDCVFKSVELSGMAEGFTVYATPMNGLTGLPIWWNAWSLSNGVTVQVCALQATTLPTVTYAVRARP